jgi:hypothetical protein
MTNRRSLPQRRACETFDLDFGGLSRAEPRPDFVNLFERQREAAE